MMLLPPVPFHCEGAAASGAKGERVGHAVSAAGVRVVRATQNWRVKQRAWTHCKSCDSSVETSNVTVLPGCPCILATVNQPVYLRENVGGCDEGQLHELCVDVCW